MTLSHSVTGVNACGVTDVKHNERERVSRQRAAERLIDMAYALTAGGPYELRLDDQRMRVPVADHVLLEWKSSSKDDCFQFELELSWSADVPRG